MSRYEKISSVIIVILLVILLAFFYNMHRMHENNESPTTKATEGESDFDRSMGSDFKIGPFTTIVDQQASGGLEADCEDLQSVISAALHDLNERLESQAEAQSDGSVWNTFEVNEPMLELFCNKTVEVTLKDATGNTLILEKLPFTRDIPAGGTPADIGTTVRIDATLVSQGKPTPSQPSATAQILIPDRFLDTMSSTTDTE